MKLIFGILIITSLVIWGVLSENEKNSKLEECSSFIGAKIYKKVNAKASKYNYYMFRVNNITYNNGFVSSRDLNIGDSIYIQYNCDDPSINRAISIKGKSFLLIDENSKEILTRLIKTVANKS